MIGGTDIVMPTNGGKCALDHCTRIVCRYWPEARFEDAISGEKYATYGDIPFAAVDQLLIYKNSESQAAFDEDRADAEQMLYLILGGGSITTVTDCPESDEIKDIIASVRASVNAENKRLAETKR